MTGEQPPPSALVHGIQQLEPMPVTAQRLLVMMNGEDVSLARIAELVEFDQAIAAKVLRMTRSWQLVMSRCLNTDVETIVGHAKQDGITFVEAEQQLFGVNHAAVGAAIAMEWQFPDEVTVNLTIDSGCVRRLGLDFTKFARICLQTDTWLRELRAAEKPPVRT